MKRWEVFFSFFTPEQFWRNLENTCKQRDIKAIVSPSRNQEPAPRKKSIMLISINAPQSHLQRHLILELLISNWEIENFGCASILVIIVIFWIWNFDSLCMPSKYLRQHWTVSNFFFLFTLSIDCCCRATYPWLNIGDRARELNVSYVLFFSVFCCRKSEAHLKILRGEK